MTLSRDSILRPSPRRYDVADWVGGTIRLQSLTSGEMQRLRDSFVDRRGKGNDERLARQRQILLCWTIVDDDGQRFFADEDASSPTWDEIDGGVLSAAYQKAVRLTGFLADYDWKAIEDAAKNSDVASV